MSDSPRPSWSGWKRKKPGRRKRLGSSAPAELNADSTVALVVSCHFPYREKLLPLLREWDRQLGQLDASRRSRVTRVVAFDSFEGECPDLPEGWILITGGWKSPVPGRNIAALQARQWIQYWDADNWPAENHLALAIDAISGAPEDTGILYPVVSDVSGRTGFEFREPPNSDPRQGMFIDTAAIWRREAILSAGGWQESRSLEDWSVARRVWELGWKLRPTGIPFAWSPGEASRTFSSEWEDQLWDAGQWGLIVLFRGDMGLLERWKKSYLDLDRPHRLGLTFVSSSEDPLFRSELVKMAKAFAGTRDRVSVVFPEIPPELRELAGFTEIHSRVAYLYKEAFGSTPEPGILTWEDDIVPPADGFFRLVKAFSFRRNVAAMAAAYPARGRQEICAVAKGRGQWEEPFRMAELQDKIYPAGMVGGGFTLWNRAALEEVPLIGPLAFRQDGLLGWDGFLCRRLNRAGWHVQLDGGTQCEHLEG